MSLVVVTGTGCPDASLTALENAGLEVLAWTPDSGDRPRAADYRRARYYVLGGDERLTRERLHEMPELRAIAFVGTGYESFVDVTAATELGLPIFNTPGITSDAVAEHAVAMLMALRRGLLLFDRDVRDGRDVNLEHGGDVRGCRVGIVGLGAVGSRVARILKTLGCHLTYYGPRRKQDLEDILSIEWVELSHLLATSDAVIVAATYSPELPPLLGEELLNCVNPGMLLINVGDARLVEPAALKRALLAGMIRASAFDGYWIEPPPTPQDDPYGMLALPASSFLMTPHIAAKTSGQWSAMFSSAVSAIVTFHLKETAT